MGGDNSAWGMDERTVLESYSPSPEGRSEAYQVEQELEQELIAQLCAQGYEWLEGVRNERALKENLRCQLEELNECRFTDDEWARLCGEYLLGGSSDGAQEKANRVQNDEVYALCLDDGTTKNVRILDKENLGRNRLQVINQYAEMHGARRSRYDVTILVNGLPLVHVELKRRGVPLEDAFDQLERYRRESFGAGGARLYEYVQLFVISNGTDTRYYPHPVRRGSRGQKGGGRGGFKFATHWADRENRVITDLLDFTKTFFAGRTLLSIIAQYCVFTVDEELLAMRPYQIAAAESILGRIREAQRQNRAGTREAGGYIWHTTGSGKTLTSFKVAQLASRIEGIDKVLFVVDRKDLDYQTIREYDRFEKGAANGNTNTQVLKRQLGDPHRRIIVTTIQKLDVFTRTARGHEVFDKQVVLIFDECHRSQFGKMHRAITRAFKRYYLFGFTGTPILADNAVGAARQTTESLFGERLHAYTIVDAIRDGNVLPFRVDYVSTLGAKAGIVDKDVQAIDISAALLAPERIRGIVSYILRTFNRHTHRREGISLEENRSRGFNSILAVDSIPMAIAYYREFKRQLAEVPVEQRLMVATVFSASQSASEMDGLLPEESFSTEQLEAPAHDGLAEAIGDYNTTFSTAYTVAEGSFQGYYQDVSQRMQRREIDLLIVVNMFLTGFDARTLNTIWVDKNLRMHGLIQAFSRTNRICNSVKTYGNVVCFRNLEEQTNEAVALFGNKHASGIALLGKYDAYYRGYQDERGAHHRGYAELVRELLKLFPLGAPIEGEANKRAFIHLWGTILRLRNVLVVFDEFEGNELLSPRAAQDYQGVYLGLYRELRLKRTGKEDIQDDLTFEIELVRQTEINLDYILSLVAEARLNGSSSLEMLLDEVREVVGASVSLWSKKELIERFIAHYSSQATKGPIKECWQQFVPGQMQQDLMRIIDREHLKPRETWRFMDGALRDGTLQTVGPDWSRILPEELTYLSEGYRETKRRVIDQLSLFFECYAGLIGQGGIASLQSYPI